MRRKWQRQVLLERDPESNGELPRHGLVRLETIIGDSKADPPIRPLVPVSKSTWWSGVRSGVFPPPVRINKGITAWRWVDLCRLLESLRPEEEWTPPGG